MSLNKVLLIGNVGAEPSVRYLEGNVKVASFNLATSERRRESNGETREITEWHSIVVWRASAEYVEKYVHKGSQLYVEGKIRTRNYTDQSGVKKYVTEIVADNLQLLGRKSDSEQGVQASAPSQSSPQYSAPQYATPQYSAPQTNQAPQFSAAPDDTDDLPF